MESFAWLALLALLFVLTILYFFLRQDGRQERIRPEVDFEVAQEIEPELGQHLLREDQEAWLPGNYGESEVNLMVRDPYCLFAYWELQPHELTEEQRSRLQLCLLQDEKEVCQSFSIGDLAGSWYFHQVSPASRFMVRLGFLGLDNTYHELHRSRPVMTPPQGPSSVVEGDYIPGLWDGENLPSSPMWWQGGKS